MYNAGIKILGYAPYKSALAESMDAHLAVKESITSFERLYSMFSEFDRTRKPKHLAEDVEQTCMQILEKVALVSPVSAAVLSSI